MWNFFNCPTCGVSNPYGALRCSSCGAFFYFPIPEGHLPDNDTTISFMKGFSLACVIMLLIGGCAGYLYVLPMMKEKDGLIDDNQMLQSELDILNGHYANLTIELNSLQSEYSILKSQYDRLEQTYEWRDALYWEMLENYTIKIQQYNELLYNYTELVSKYNALSENYTSLSTSHSNMLYTRDIKFIVLLYFQTKHFSEDHWLYLEIEPELFFSYREKVHHPGSLIFHQELLNYVVIDDITKRIVDAVLNETSSDKEELANSLLSLTQNKNAISGHQLFYPGVYENATGENIGTFYQIDSIAKYPVETLVFGSGECLDDTILYLSLLKSAGIDSAFLYANSESHVLAGVTLDTPPLHNTDFPTSWYADHDDVRYYTAECTGYGWHVGDLPESFKSISVNVEPVQ